MRLILTRSADADLSATDNQNVCPLPRRRSKHRAPQCQVLARIPIDQVLRQA